MYMYIHDKLLIDLSSPCRSCPASHRRNDEVRRVRRWRHRQPHGYPAVRRVTAPADLDRGRNSPGAAGRTKAALLASKGGVRGDRSLGRWLPAPLESQARSFECGAGKEAGPRDQNTQGEMMMTMPTGTRARFSINRVYHASIKEVWELWTTKSGIESWWGPEGLGVVLPALN